MLFQNNDLIILTDTWSNEKLSIPGFHLFTIPAKKHRMKKHGRFSGGIVLGFKNNLKQGITLVSYHADYIWCKLDKNFYHTKKHIFVCAACIPPKESPYFNSDIFHKLEGDIAKLSKDDYILLADDFNARTGCLLDSIDSHSCHHIPGDNIPLHSDFKRRKNFDKNINEHGNALLDICKACDLRILNGRTKGDPSGLVST